MVKALLEEAIRKQPQQVKGIPSRKRKRKGSGEIVLMTKRSRVAEDEELIDSTMIATAVSAGGDFIQRLAQCATIEDVAKGSYVTLPAHPLHSTTERTRFHIDHDTNTLQLLCRDLGGQILRSMMENNAQNISPALYIHGPQGVGKSHSLYEAVCALSQQDNNRVIYIPDCGAWSITNTNKEAFNFLLHAILLAFHADQQIVDLVRHGTYTVDFLSEFVYHRLPVFCQEHNLNLYIVFDQHNSIPKSHRKRFPWKIIEKDLPVSSYWKRNSLIVISASANNEYYLKVASENHWEQIIHNTGFTEDEFHAWCECENLFSGCSEEVMGDVQFWTNRIPFELSLLHKQAKGSSSDFHKVIRDYRVQRINSLEAQQMKFEKQHLVSDFDFDRARNAVVSMYLGLPSDDSGILLNQQLMYKAWNDQEQIQQIFPTTPLAKSVLVRMWGASIDAPLQNMYRTVFSSPGQFTSDVRGRVLEKYILQQIERQKRCELSTFRLKRDLCTVVAPKAMKFRDLIVKKFEGRNTIAKGMNWNQSGVLIPLCSSYTGVDLLLWDSGNRELWFVQITVDDPISKHTVKHFEGDLAKKWLSETPSGQPKVLWIGTNRNFTQNSDYHKLYSKTAPYHVTLLNELDQELFPLLREWK
eukprot:CAMPEP_0174260474 /NCGR_PEP_ID=MMETSP0439-20130205/9732_1 /TAXON_ID=0 /ORGANISM="Stereomyxa ramosa, Strain Chinc5" /LENGTH=639 /DNA_ID=CAMNT_0015344725 /DNA_START=273 /DNA_END=2192 /DNA_ORIENTATION=-